MAKKRITEVAVLEKTHLATLTGIDIVEVQRKWQDENGYTCMQSRTYRTKKGYLFYNFVSRGKTIMNTTTISFE